MLQVLVGGLLVLNDVLKVQYYDFVECGLLGLFVGVELVGGEGVGWYEWVKLF